MTLFFVSSPIYFPLTIIDRQKFAVYFLIFFPPLPVSPQVPGGAASGGLRGARHDQGKQERWISRTSFGARRIRYGTSKRLAPPATAGVRRLSRTASRPRPRSPMLRAKNAPKRPSRPRMGADSEPSRARMGIDSGRGRAASALGCHRNFGPVRYPIL